VATVSYLKAEDANENLHDILGKHATLPHQRAFNWNWQTTGFRFYVGAVQNIATSGTHANRLYLAFQNASGQMVVASTLLDASLTTPRNISVSGNHSASPTFFELYIYSASGEKIILSSGYTGGQL
jgi:hypothetical protein